MRNLFMNAARAQMKLFVVLTAALWSIAMITIIRDRLRFDGPGAWPAAWGRERSSNAEQRMEPQLATEWKQQQQHTEVSHSALPEPQRSGGQQAGVQRANVTGTPSSGADGGGRIRLGPMTHTNLGRRISRLRLIQPKSDGGAALLCVPAKTASTSLWHALYRAFSNGARFKPCAGEAHAGNSVHALSGCGWEKYIEQPIRVLSNLEEYEKVGNSVYKLAIAREPLGRAWSSYKSKVCSTTSAHHPLTWYMLDP